MQSKRRILGQHFIDDEETLRRIVALAEIQYAGRVLEIGAGKGSLTKELCRTRAKIVSYEIDRELFPDLKSKFSNIKNVQLVNADAFKSNISFDVLVANLPYSRSEEFIEWLAGKNFRKAVAMLQTDFVDKILSRSGKNYRAVSVIAQYCFTIRRVFEVPARLFKPPPKVSSSVIVIERKPVTPTKSEIKSLKYLWSFKGKTVASAIKAIAKKSDKNLKTVEVPEKRIAELSPEQAFRVAKAIDQAN
ncbi:MAG: 16S rRNA (adenine(1518)-N(6)/adenine(1519)-N(6))-dimethyltransferase RsmA [Thaumarchaeota archaeon]|nr:16S rRNA (adenine(1518)-N(6)/adenine(1519)-N(6))-dimethyltransferase RsmA [Nitrososphaerota archaeon]